jgi:hypothetical protein
MTADAVAREDTFNQLLAKTEHLAALARLMEVTAGGLGDHKTVESLMGLVSAMTKDVEALALKAALEHKPATESKAPDTEGAPA